MKKNTIITLIFILPILVNCQTLEDRDNPNLDNKSISFDQKEQPDIRGIISYDKYQVVVANGNETVLEIATRLGLDPRKFSLFNGLVESYRPRQGELLALNKNIIPIKKGNTSVWSKKSTKNVLKRAEETKQVNVPKKNDFVKHKVESGETIYSIARLYGVSVTSLAKLNKLDAEFKIYVGQNIIIPITQKKIISSKNNIKSTNKKLANNNGSDSDYLPKQEKNNSSKTSFILPVNGKVISKYNPNSEKQKNQGIDLQVPPGSPVFAASSGVVALITDNTENFGKIVLIRHKDNLISIYGRVAKVSVEKNEEVTKGQKIGSMAEKVSDGGNQVILHFEIRKGTKSVNPENFFE